MVPARTRGRRRPEPCSPTAVSISKLELLRRASVSWPYGPRISSASPCSASRARSTRAWSASRRRRELAALQERQRAKGLVALHSISAQMRPIFWRTSGSSTSACRGGASSWRLDQPASAARRSGHARQRAAAALVAQGGLAMAQPSPSLPIWSLFSTARCHEHLAEFRGARDLLEGADVDAGLAHVHEEAGDALVLGHLGVRAREEQAPVGNLAAARPDLLPVDDEMSP